MADGEPVRENVLEALGWGPDLQAVLTADEGPTDAGRVLRVDRGLVRVVTAGGEVDALPGHGGGSGPGEPAEAVCTGDWVTVSRSTNGPAVVTAVLPRRTVLRRADADGGSTAQALAANADAVALVEGLEPVPSLNRVERLLALLWETGATPLIVLTKADRVAEPSAEVARVAEVAAGVQVLAVSSTTGAGLSELAPHVAFGRTLALVGRSGAGKSTLTNLLADADLATGAIRADGRGRHTTVRRELVRIPGGGAVLDTPGLRGAGLWDAAGAVEQVFADIAELGQGCRFADCTHEVEPDCAVQAALTEGTLDPRRWASFRKLRKEAEWIASRTDARLRAERTKVWKQIHQDFRRYGRPRP